VTSDLRRLAGRQAREDHKGPKGFGGLAFGWRLFGLTALVAAWLAFSPATPLRAEVVVMLGDSLTAGGRWADLKPGAEILNHGVSGDGAAEAAARVGAVAAARPDQIFFQLGVNDLARGLSPRRAVEAQREVWRALRAQAPQAVLIVCSLLPVRESGLTSAGGFNRLIRDMNDLLAQAAAEEGLTFVDLHGALTGPDQQLPAAMTFDGLHLNPPAYDVWRATLGTFLK
jgi:lysophospholipase L1-like esterase